MRTAIERNEVEAGVVIPEPFDQDLFDAAIRAARGSPVPAVALTARGRRVVPSA